MISTAYQYYLSNYAYQNQSVSRYDTHKNSELKDLYNRMRSLNKRTPIYKIDMSEKTQHYAIDLKESARRFRNTLLETSGNQDSPTAFEEMDVYTSDENVLEVNYHGNLMDDKEEGAAHLLTVDQLALPQINMGDYLPSDQLSLPPGQYAFELAIGGSSYEFQYSIRDDSSNLKIQEKLARLINRSSVGLFAEVLKDDNGSSSISLKASNSGHSRTQEYAFKISDQSVSKMSGSVSLFGLDKISQHPTNAMYTLDGDALSSPSNTIALDRNYTVSLKQPTQPNQVVEVGMNRSADKVVKSIFDMVNGYNQLHRMASSSTSASFKNRLLSDLDYLSKRFQPVLEGTGISVQEDGELIPDEERVTQAYKEGILENSAPHIQNFRSALLRQTEQISLNPMDYMNKKLIAYPNPIRSFPSIYQSSVYSGMIFNGYI